LSNGPVPVSEVVSAIRPSPHQARHNGPGVGEVPEAAEVPGGRRARRARGAGRAAGTDRVLSRA